MYSQLIDFLETASTKWDLAVHPSVRSTIEGWCLDQLAPWITADRAAADEAACQELNAQRPWTFLFRIDAHGAVSLDKPKSIDTGGEPAHRRVRYYARFLTRVARQIKLARPILIAIDVNDSPVSGDATPIFSFQKAAGTNNILVPDIDFLAPAHNSLPSWLTTDRTPWRKKAPSAVFAGSTTGGRLDRDSLLARPIPRLRAGLFFRDEPEVDFRLPFFPECDAATEALLRQLGFGGPPLTWPQQFGHRFILSMDGNGATCSRPVIVLRSRCVLLKYASPHQLYWSQGLQPWRHFVPIGTDGDVLRVLALARRQPKLFQAIAAEGRRFRRTFLSRRAVDHYMGRLLQLYAAL